MSAFLDYQATGDSSGYTGGDYLPGDTFDYAKMQPIAGGSDGSPWWARTIEYGITRAIDNRFGPTNVAGNTNPGTFAGQNGRTYVQPAHGTGASVQAPGGFAISPMTLVAGAALLYFALKG